MTINQVILLSVDPRKVFELAVSHVYYLTLQFCLRGPCSKHSTLLVCALALRAPLNLTETGLELSLCGGGSGGQKNKHSGQPL